FRRQYLAQPVGFLAGARQIELDGRAVAFFAIDLDVAAGLLDEPVDHAEAETGSLADVLGGEKRLEDLVADRGRDAVTGVADRNHRVGARGDVALRLRLGFVGDAVAALARQLAA